MSRVHINDLFAYNALKALKKWEITTHYIVKIWVCQAKWFGGPQSQTGVPSWETLQGGLY